LVQGKVTPAHLKGRGAWTPKNWPAAWRCSLGLDLKILFKTMKKAVKDLFRSEKK